MQDLVKMDGIAKLIRTGKPATEAKDILKASELTPIQEQWLEKRLLRADFSERIRLYYYLGVALGGKKGAVTKRVKQLEGEGKTFAQIQEDPKIKQWTQEIKEGTLNMRLEN